MCVCIKINAEKDTITYKNMKYSPFKLPDAERRRLFSLRYQYRTHSQKTQHKYICAYVLSRHTRASRFYLDDAFGTPVFSEPRERKRITHAKSFVT